MPAAPSGVAGLRPGWRYGRGAGGIQRPVLLKRKPMLQPGPVNAVPVRWIKGNSDGWCPLNAVKLNHGHFRAMVGVYIIWHAGREPAGEDKQC